MIQKIIQVGNSLAITIPKDFIRLLKGRKGGFVEVQLYPRQRRLIVRLPKKEKIEEVVDPEVYKVAKNLLARYLPAFKELAKK